MKRTPIFLCLTFVCLIAAGLLGSMASCSGGSASPPASIPAPVSGLGSTSAVTSSIASSLGSIGGGGAALVKGVEEDSGDIDYSCTTNEDFTEVTCDCSGGGTISSFYGDEAFTIEDCGDDTIGVIFSSSFSETFDNCVVEECGTVITLNGEIEGAIEGSFDCDGNEDITADVSTGGTCSGMTASPEGEEDVNIGFNAVFTFDGIEETFSGTFCTDPPGDPDGLVEFDSHEELETAVDPDGTCEEAETADCEDTCITECTDTGGDETDCEDECVLECE